MAEAVIVDVSARQIYDSRARPTIEVDVTAEEAHNGRRVTVTAQAPSGASTGRHEAVELRDDAGTGPITVFRAVRNVSEHLLPALRGRSVLDQAGADQVMRDADGTPNLGRLGANAVVATSMAICRASAAVLDVPLYLRIAELAGTAPKVPGLMVNMISGGRHGGDNADVQDWLAVPSEDAPYPHQLHQIVRLYWALAECLTHAGRGRAVGDEGGYAPALTDNTEAFTFIATAADSIGSPLGDELTIAVDVAATQLVTDDGYALREHDKPLSSAELLGIVADWTNRWAVTSVEDPLGEDDWAGWADVVRALSPAHVVGDDLFATSPARLQRGIETNAADTVLVKINQNGTLTGALEVVEMARAAGMRTIVSARSGETEDDFLADLATGTAADQIKVGSVARSERLSKYNRLLRIDAQLRSGVHEPDTTTRSEA